MVLFDNNVLCLLLHPDADPPNDPATGQPIVRAQDRISFLCERLESSGVRILIPAPVLSEFLTFADADYLLQINQTMWFEVGPFDQRAAIESAIALRRSLRSGQGKKLGLTSPWQKIKVDRQIVAIGKVYGVTQVYSTDTDVLTIARESGIEAIHAADLPLPPTDQIQLTLEDLVVNQPSLPPATAPELLSGPTPGAVPESASAPEPILPVTLRDAQEQQPPDSSQTAPLPPRSEK